MDTSTAVNIAVAALTALYVIPTWVLTAATLRSVKTSTAALQEAREQRMELSKPIVLAKLWLSPPQDSPKGKVITISSSLHNVGTGPALNLVGRLTFGDQEAKPFPNSWNAIPYLTAGQNTATDESMSGFVFVHTLPLPDELTGLAVPTMGALHLGYTSIYERQFAVTQPFEITTTPKAAYSSSLHRSSCKKPPRRHKSNALTYECYGAKTDHCAGAVAPSRLGSAVSGYRPCSGYGTRGARVTSPA